MERRENNFEHKLALVFSAGSTYLLFHCFLLCASAVSRPHFPVILPYGMYIKRG